MKILVVDDSMVIRRAIEGAIGEGGHEIQSAANGVEAIARFEEFHPEVVTMDITMPEMDGLQCVLELLERDPDVKILVVSALADASTAVEAVRRGARGFLLKPFTPASINSELTELFKEDE
jgi:two-component system chemotaxis response regulator CheY